MSILIFFKQNTVIKAKEIYDYSSFLSRLCQELTQLIAVDSRCRAYI